MSSISFGRTCHLATWHIHERRFGHNFLNRTAEHHEHKIPYYETKSVVALIATAVLASETSLQSRCSRLSSDHATELYIATPFILLLGPYVSLRLVAHNNLIKAIYLESFHDGTRPATGAVFRSYEAVGYRQAERWVRSRGSSLAKRWTYSNVRLG